MGLPQMGSLRELRGVPQGEAIERTPLQSIRA